MENGSTLNSTESLSNGIEANLDWFEEYTYRRRSVTLPDMDYSLQFTLIQGGIVHFGFTDTSTTNPLIVIISLSISGGEISRTEIPLDSEFTQIVGFDITNDENIAIFAVEFDEEYEEILAVYYAEFDAMGRELLRFDFSDMFVQMPGSFEIEQAVFAGDGNIAVAVWKGLGTEVYLLNIESDEYAVLELDGRVWREGMIRLNDERVMTIDNFPTTILREINFEEDDWGETLPLVSDHHYRMFKAGSDSTFDFLSVDWIYLYGHDAVSGEQTVLLNLVEQGFHHIIHAYEIANRELIILSGVWENDEMILQLFILSPLSRATPDDRTVITVGQIGAPGETFPMIVSEFNLESDRYIIEVVDYFDFTDGGDFYDGVRSGIIRLQIDLMTGQGPDILIIPSGFRMNSELLIDLYPLIDADPMLSRSDFLPNMLAALESPDNTLRAIAEYFTLRTIIGLPEAVEHIVQWTPSELLRFVRQTYGTHYPFSPNLSSEWFLRMILTNSGTAFIDWYLMEANLDSDAFIEILEVAKILNGVVYRGGGMWAPQPDELMARGEQLLQTENFFGWGAFRRYLVMQGDFEVLGIPTVDGGENVLVPFMQMGINAASENIDGAWSFLREFLTPDGVMSETLREGTIPYRVDLFEQILTDISTPIMEADGDGNMIEMPQTEFWVSGSGGDFDIINVYAIASEQADRFRNIVENAVPLRGQPIYQGLWDLIEGDLARFFSGVSSAEDTARVMQSRISIYLAEQS